MSTQHLHTDFLITETKDLLIRQLDDANSIDSKASILLGTSALIITATLTILISVSPLEKQTPTFTLFWVLVSGGLVTLVISILFAIQAYRTTTYKNTINPRSAYEQWADLDVHTIQTQYLHNLIDAYEKNTDIIGIKAKTVDYSLNCLGVAALIGAVAVVVYFISI